MQTPNRPIKRSVPMKPRKQRRDRLADLLQELTGPKPDIERAAKIAKEIKSRATWNPRRLDFSK